MVSIRLDTFYTLEWAFTSRLTALSTDCNFIKVYQINYIVKVNYCNLFIALKIVLYFYMLLLCIDVVTCTTNSF